MSPANSSDHLCDFYTYPPVDHGVPVPNELQSILSECVFVENDRLVDLATAARHMGSMAAVESACRRCSKCCYGLQQARYPHRPTRCNAQHLLCQISRSSQQLQQAA